MLGSSTSNERNNSRYQMQHHNQHQIAHDPISAATAIAMANRQQQEYQNAAATAAAAVSALGGPHEDGHFTHHHHPGHLNHSAEAAAAAAAAAHMQQQQHHHQLHSSAFPQHPLQPDHHMGVGVDNDYNGTVLVSRFNDNEVIKTFRLKQEMIKFVKTVLSEQEQCKIVINSSKPKAVYFQCERSGSFRTTVKEASKRQRVAYTKRNKCGYRLVANLYPPKKKDKMKKDSPISNEFGDANVDVKLSDYPQDYHDEDSDEEIWMLRMIHPAHNHPLEPPLNTGIKKKRSKFSRTLVEKPLHHSRAMQMGHPNYNELLDAPHQQPQYTLHHQQPYHPQPQFIHHPQQPHAPSVQDVAVIAAMGGDPAALQDQHQVDPNIDPNVDPSVQEHDHSHRGLR